MHSGDMILTLMTIRPVVHTVERSEIVVAVKAVKRTYEGTAEGVLLGTQESR